MRQLSFHARLAGERCRAIVLDQIRLPSLPWPVGARIASAGAIFAVVAAGILLSYSGCHCLFKQYDDAYITFRYAEKLATGHGLVFNVGDATDSASSFLYTLVLAFCHFIGLHNLPVVATLLGVACAAGTCAIVYLGCSARTKRPFLSAILALTVGMHGLISGWAVSGMETLFFSVLVALAVYRLFIRAELTWFDAVLISAIDLTRFEGLIVASAWFLLVLLRYRAAHEDERRRLLAQVAWVGGTFAAFLIFKHHVYGTFLPHAFELKRITTLYAAKPRALWDVWGRTASVLLLLAFTGLFTLPKRRESAVWVFYCALSLASVLVGPYADWARYSVHLLPVAMLLGCVPLAMLLRTLPTLALAGCWMMTMQAHEAFVDLRAANTTGAFHQACRLQLGAYLEEHIDPDQVVLSSDIGAIAYAAPSISFIDAVGLTSRDVLEARGRGESVDPILTARAPSLIADTCHGTCTHATDFSSEGWLSNQNYWLTPLPGYTYGARLHHGKVLQRCGSPDGFSFAATRFELRDGRPATP